MKLSMSKNSQLFYLFATLMLGLLLFITVSSNVYAEESKAAIGEEQHDTLSLQEQLTNKEIGIINDFVNYDKITESFMINPDISSVLDTHKINIAQDIIIETNRHIQLAKQDFMTNVTIETPEGIEFPINKLQSRAYGKNDIKFYWNYARVWLNKGTVQGIGTGLTLGGIWIPEPIVSKVAASLGVGIALTPSGIWFDYNYFNGVLTGNFGFQ